MYSLPPALDALMNPVVAAKDRLVARSSIRLLLKLTRPDGRFRPDSNDGARYDILPRPHLLKD
jgi:hypothetical protein